MDSPCKAGAGSSVPVFEHSTKTTHGSMHVRRFRRDAPPACFGGLAPMVAVWQGKCRHDALPRWKDFAIEDFVGWPRYVALSRSEEHTSELPSLIRISSAVFCLNNK